MHSSESHGKLSFNYFMQNCKMERHCEKNILFGPIQT